MSAGIDLVAFAQTEEAEVVATSQGKSGFTDSTLWGGGTAPSIQRKKGWDGREGNRN